VYQPYSVILEINKILPLEETTARMSVSIMHNFLWVNAKRKRNKEKRKGIKMDMKKLWYLAFAITGVIWGACDNDDDNNDISEIDRTYITSTAEANQAEIELGQIAASRSTTDGVKMFGQMMVMEHQTAQNDLKLLATNKKVTLTNTLSQKHQQLRDSLMKWSGYAFDTAYIHSMVRDHTTVQALFQNEISTGKEQSVKDYANKYLPHIQMHLQKADSISGTLTH
jgi:putative membrane protein